MIITFLTLIGIVGVLYFLIVTAMIDPGIVPRIHNPQKLLTNPNLYEHVYINNEKVSLKYCCKLTSESLF